jgi:broad specificity phosphatase PhoE
MYIKDMIYVTRHGQSMTNIDADLNSEFPINIRNNILTETGIQQAMDFAHQLKAT